MMLAIVTVFYVLPLTVFADIINDSPTSVAGATNEDAEYIPEGLKATYEVKSLREESSKTFRLEDGTYVSAQYMTPVHKLDESGEWVDIDNALDASGTEYSTSDARVKFVKKINGSKELFTLHEGNTKITVALPDAIKKTPGTVYNGSDPAGYTELQKMMNLERLTSRIVYADILDGADVEYVISQGSIKENIIVKERKESYSYTFNLSLNNLNAALGVGGNVYLRELSGAAKYVIPAPTVYDANGSLCPSEAAYYTLTYQGDGKYTLTVTVSSAWMNSADRAFPVTVDPPLWTEGAYKNEVMDIEDTFIV